MFGNKDLGCLVTCRKVAILDRVASRLERNNQLYDANLVRQLQHVGHDNHAKYTLVGSFKCFAFSHRY